MILPYYSDDSVTLYTGDAVEVLRDLPDDRADCVVTSPPYWGLRLRHRRLGRRHPLVRSFHRLSQLRYQESQIGSSGFCLCWAKIWRVFVVEIPWLF